MFFKIMAKEAIAVFDFDGTLTNKDTLFLFISFVYNKRKLIIGFLRNFKALLLYGMGLKSNSEAKEIIFSYFFRNMPLHEFNSYSLRFADKYRSSILRESVINILQGYLESKSKVYIITASITNWVSPFFCDRPKIVVLGTEIEIDSLTQRLTGRFLGSNCYGQEKVNRLLEEIGNREKYYIYAYGDSRGDKEIIDYADQGLYLWENDYKDIKNQ